MDIYEFTKALRRQWKLLVIGFVSLIVAVLAAVFEVKDVDGEVKFESRITPKFESSVEMVVVPAGLESLSSRDIASGFGAAAELYTQMLETPEAARQIEETQGIELIETLSARNAGSFITVTAIANTPEDAVAGARGSFRWLEGRFADPPILAQLPDPEPEILPDEFLGTLLVEVDRLYATADPGLALIIGNPAGNEVALSLQGAAGQVESVLTRIRPEDPLLLSVERQVGVSLDSASLNIPELSEIEGDPPPLVLSIDWGAVSFEPVPLDSEGQPLPLDPTNPPGAEINPSRLAIRWDIGSVVTRNSAASADKVSLLLISEDLTAEETGQRRTPVMVMALLVVGSLALLVAATTIDTWQTAKLEQQRQRRGDQGVEERPETEGPFPEIVEPLPEMSQRRGIHLSPSDPGTRRLPGEDAYQSGGNRRPRASGS